MDHKPEELAAEVEAKAEEVVEEVVIMQRIEKGFEQWLGRLSEEQLEQVVSRLMRGHQNEKATREYTACVKSMEHAVRYCSKCRRGGCEKCDYLKSLRYVVRWQKPADWWRRSSQAAVTGTVRFLNAAT